MYSKDLKVLSLSLYSKHSKSQCQLAGAYDRLQDAVATTAFHNLGKRYGPPKCHPNTRVAVIKRIMDWILRRGAETCDKLIMPWLSGPAGAGKSAVAQSTAELCYGAKYLLVGFFGRSDSTGNHGRSLIATIGSSRIARSQNTRDEEESVQQILIEKS